MRALVAHIYQTTRQNNCRQWINIRIQTVCHTLVAVGVETVGESSSRFFQNESCQKMSPPLGLLAKCDFDEHHFGKNLKLLSPTIIRRSGGARAIAEGDEASSRSRSRSAEDGSMEEGQLRSSDPSGAVARARIPLPARGEGPGPGECPDQAGAEAREWDHHGHTPTAAAQ